MNDFEKILTKVIDHFVALQRWNLKPESTRKPTSVFPTILAIDRGLKNLKKAEKNHPLQELVREVQDAFDTKEFRAILLAAFNWRSASRRAAVDPKQKDVKTQPKNAGTAAQKYSATQQKHTGSPFDNICLPKQTHEQINRDAENTEKFFQNFKKFIENIPAKTMRKLMVPEKHVDIYQAGRRLDGSYGSNQ
jgi:hypothetical protein